MNPSCKKIAAAVLAVSAVFGVSLFLRIQYYSHPHCGSVAESLRFSCYAQYYRTLAAASGVRAAIEDMERRIEDDEFINRECHLLVHEIGRDRAANAPSVGAAFAEGDPYCLYGYYHGVMEGMIQGRGTKDLSGEYVNSLCAPFRERGDRSMVVDYNNCSHGIGHGIMNLNGNELFGSLATCDLLDGERERELCWYGVFMENVLADFRDHATNYLRFEDPAYPCNAVDERYKNACYSSQSFFIYQATGNFADTFAVCRAAPAPHRDVCFEGIGRVAGAREKRGDLEAILKNCQEGLPGREQERCVAGAAGNITAFRQNTADASKLCLIASGNLRTVCLTTLEKDALLLPRQ